MNNITKENAKLTSKVASKTKEVLTLNKENENLLQ